MNGPRDMDQVKETAERYARQAQLSAAHGIPETVAPAAALALARAQAVQVPDEITPDDIWASVYRDEQAADAWLESNRVHNGHPVLAKVCLPGGQVVGIMDLRPALARARENQ